MTAPLNEGRAIAVESGRLQGRAADEETRVSVFKGIPFAAPPVGLLRWRPPGPPAAWDGVRDSTAFAAAPVQIADAQSSWFGATEATPMDEDCLQLNIWTPAESDGERLPVMVWIHGGGFRQGSAIHPMYNGVELAKRGVVVVTVNYRLNLLGMFAHPLLSAESPDGASGNYALMDQIAAFRWVRRNIAAFGGDPANVTAFGESAGSRSIALMLTSPLAVGAFDRGICQSGALRDVGDPLGEREALGLEIAGRLGCEEADDPLAALRRIDARDLAALTDEYDNNPMVDGYVLPNEASTVYGDGRQQAVPLIIGVNGDEGALFAYRIRDRLKSDGDYDRYLDHSYGAGAGKVRQLYPPPGELSEIERAGNVIGDQNFVAPARRHAEWHAGRGHPTWLYQFTRRPPYRAGEVLGSFHGAELTYVFGGGVRCGLFEPGSSRITAMDHAISAAMMDAWTSFARSGDPNADGVPRWDRFDPAAANYLEFGDRIAPGDGFGGAHLRDLPPSYRAALA